MVDVSLSEEETKRIAETIYLFGYPLLLTDVMREAQTALVDLTVDGASVNRFLHRRSLPDSQESRSYPNVDCLLSTAWLDLSEEALLLDIPRNHRYYLLSFFSNWYEIFGTISPRTTLGQCSLAIVGPRWRGELPARVRKIVAPTENVWIEGWFETTGPKDSELVHQTQDEFHLSALGQWSGSPALRLSPFHRDVDRKMTPQEQVARLDERAFYSRLSRLMERNPVPSCDAETVAEFVRIGFVASEDFDFGALPAATAQAMRLAVSSGQALIAQAVQAAAGFRTINQWSLSAHTGDYQTNYLERAAQTRLPIGTTLAKDILWFQTGVDNRGDLLDGTNEYRVDFSRDLFPPVNAFWSITMYDSRQRLVANEIHRYGIGDRNNLRLNADKSLSIYVQHNRPSAAKDSNWLPAPKDRFNLVLRLYWPKGSAFIGNWQPPIVMRTN